MIKSIMTLGDGKLEKKDMLRTCAGFVIGVCADMVVSALIGAHLPYTKSGVKRILRKVGAFAIAVKVGEDVENFFYKVVDDTADAVKEVKEELSSEEANAAVKEGA